jgi:hypothetical protein
MSFWELELGQGLRGDLKLVGRLWAVTAVGNLHRVELAGKGGAWEGD